MIRMHDDCDHAGLRKPLQNAQQSFPKPLLLYKIKIVSKFTAKYHIQELGKLL